MGVVFSLQMLNQLTIARKLWVIVLIPTISALILACVIFYAFHMSSLRQSLKREASTGAQYIIESVSGAMRHQNYSSAEATLNQLLSHNVDVLGAALYDRQGNRVATYIPEGGEQVLPPKASAYLGAWFSGGDLHLAQQIDMFAPEAMQIQVVGSFYVISNARAVYLHSGIFILTTLLILAICIIVATLMTGKLHHLVSKPIENLSMLMKNLSLDKDYSIRAVPQGDDEISTLVNNFNDMLDQIESKDEALLDAQNMLEDRVKTRTQALERETQEHKQTAQRLRREIKVREGTEEALQDAMRRAERESRFKSSFLANMSHEIRTPMSGVLGMAELLKRSELTEKQDKQIDTILNSATAMLQILDDILDHSKVEAGAMELNPAPFDLLLLAEDVIELFTAKAEAKGIDLLLRFAPSTPRHVVGDGGRIRQVLSNLVSNAIKFTKEGYVALNVDATEFTRDSAKIVLSVSDTGCGIPQERLTAIFGQYEQADSSVSNTCGGTGLGLSISHKLVDLMGGVMGVQSQVDIGSRFRFTLQLPLSEERNQSETKSSPFRKKRVLIIDRSSSHGRIVREMCTEWRMRAKAVDTIERAVAYLERALEKDKEIAVCLIDEAFMELHGDILKPLIKKSPSLFVRLNGVQNRFEQQHAEEEGFQGILTRPVRRSEFRQGLLQLWALHQGVEVESFDDSMDTPLPIPDHPFNGHRVLVAEDNLVNQQLTQDLLESLGCTVDVVGDGQAALDKLKQHEDYHAVLLDCQMPILDGFTTAAKIRRSNNGHSDIPLIALTAHALQSTKDRCLAAGMNDYLCKPLDPKRLRDTLGRWLLQAGFHTDDGLDSGVPQDDLVVLDMEQALWVTGGKTAMFGRIAKIFMEHMPTRMEELAAAMEDTDYQEAARLAHSIKGAAASVGGVQLQAATDTLEAACRSASPEGIQAAYADTKVAFDALQSALQSYLRGSTIRQKVKGEI